jgi:hypothetical protein
VQGAVEVWLFEPRPGAYRVGIRTELALLRATHADVWFAIRDWRTDTVRHERHSWATWKPWGTRHWTKAWSIVTPHHEFFGVEIDVLNRGYERFKPAGTWAHGLYLDPIKEERPNTG